MNEIVLVAADGRPNQMTVAFSGRNFGRTKLKSRQWGRKR
jgi:hypothetical protein